MNQDFNLFNKRLLLIQYRSIFMATGLFVIALFLTSSLQAKEHPCLAFTKREVKEIRSRFTNLPEAKKAGQRILRKAEKLLEKPIHIPSQGGQWAGYYVCKSCGMKLKFISLTKHQCKKCQRVYSDKIFQEVGVAYLHKTNFRELSLVSSAYILDPRPEFAQHIRKILLQYASFYKTIPFHDFLGQKGEKSLNRGARLTAQTLSESHLLVHAAKAYDNVYYDACFKPEDRNYIENDLIREMVKTILRKPWGRLNWQSEHNAAIACAGYLLDDQKLIDKALHDPNNGFHFQIRTGVMPNGMWYEGAIGYHFGTLSSHIKLMEAAFRNGNNLYALPKVKKMFEAPLQILMPDNTFPPLNDSYRQSIDGYRHIYQIAARRYKSKTFQRIGKLDRLNEILFYGKHDIAKNSSMPVPESTSGEADGLAILRNSDNNNVVYLDFFKSTAQHTQPARLHFLLYAHDDLQIMDPKTMSYGHPLHEGWGRQTIAHNTVVVNEQQQVKSEGELHSYKTGNGWSMVRATANKAYPGVKLDRTILLNGNLIADVFRCTSEKNSTFDLPLHARGDWPLPDSGIKKIKLSNSPGYKEFREVAQLEKLPEQLFISQQNGHRISVTIFDQSNVFSALGYANDLTTFRRMLLRRQKGKSADFVAVYQILGPGEEPTRNSARFGKTIQVTCGDLELSVNDDTTVTAKKKIKKDQS